MSSIEKATFSERVKGRVRKIGRITLISVLLIGIAIFSFLYWSVYAEGVRAGVVINIRKQGTIFKTYEGQLNLQAFGSLKGANTFAETFDFSVEGSREDLIKEIEDVARTGERVNLRYIKRRATFPWRGESKYFVVAVESSGSVNNDTIRGIESK